MNETYQFTTAQELKDFLNQFTDKDLREVYLETPQELDFITVDYIEKDMGDESTVVNLKFR